MKNRKYAVRDPQHFQHKFEIQEGASVQTPLKKLFRFFEGIFVIFSHPST